MKQRDILPYLGVEALPGTVARQRIAIAEFADGSPVTLPVIRFEGAGDGPTVYIQAGIHGDEVTGIQAVWELARLLDPARLRGRVVIVPVANTPAFLTRARGYMLEERILQDANRLFPGNRKGLLSERIVAHLFAGFVLHADLTIDLHCPLDGSEIVDFMHVGPRDNSDGQFDLRQRTCRAFGMPFHFYRKPGMKLGSSNMSASISVQGAEAGKAVIMAEFGRSREIDFLKARRGADGLLRVLAEMGMWPEFGSNPAPVQTRDFSNIHLVHADCGGGLRPLCRLGDEIAAGTPLAEIVDVFGQTTEIIRAHVDGFVLRIMTYGAVASGAEVAWIGN